MDPQVVFSPFLSILGDIYKEQHPSHSKMIQGTNHIFHLLQKVYIMNKKNNF